MKAVQIHNGFFLVFDRGEEVMATLAAFAEREEVHWGAFEAIGAVDDVEIGYYDLTAREYVFRQEAGPFEVCSFKGNLSEFEEVPIVHAHASLARADETLEMIGGHVRSARVALTLEMTLWFVSQPLMREPDEDTGLNLITLEV
jgi:predicted DNA-binding protein with PD1-like motif